MSESITTTPQVALDGAGNAVAIGIRDAGPKNLVEAIQRPAGGEWSGPVVLSGPDEEEPTTAQVEVDAAGNAVAVWGAWVNPGYAIEAASRPAGGEWSDSEPLGGTPFLGTRADLAMNAAGDAVATWTGFDGGQVVVAAVRPAGGEWSAPEEISAAAEEGLSPQVGIDAAGNATAVWERDSGGGVVRTARRPAGGTWSGPEDLSAPGDEATAPRIAVDAAGDAVAAWTVTDGADASVHAKERSAGGVWSAQQRVSAEGEVAREPEVAIDANGAVANWRAPVGGDLFLRGAVLSPGAEEWSAPADVSGPTDQFRSSDLETNGAAGAIAIWTRFDGTGNSVQASVRPPGGEWTDPEDISTEGQEAGLADLAFDGAGDAIAVWGAAVETGFTFQASGYDFVAPRLDDLRIPTNGEAGKPVSFAVSPFDLFSLGATSWDFGDGAAATGNAVSHVYPKPGDYTVTVSSVDAGGNKSTRTAAIAIAGSEAPTRPASAAVRQLKMHTLRIERKSLRGLRRSGALNVVVTVDSAATVKLKGRAKLRPQGKSRGRLVSVFVRKTLRFAGPGQQTVRLTLSEWGRKALRGLSKVRIRVDGAASDPAGGIATDSAALTLRD